MVEGKILFLKISRVIFFFSFFPVKVPKEQRKKKSSTIGWLDINKNQSVVQSKRRRRKIALVSFFDIDDSRVTASGLYEKK